MKNLIEKLIPIDELMATVKRFPSSVLCAGGLFLIAIFNIHDVIDYEDEVMGRICAILSCLYFWFGISKLISESQETGYAKHLMIVFIGVVGITALIVTSQIWWQNLVFLIPALLLFLMFAPYLKGGDDLSVWFFNRMVWFGVGVSYLALLMFAGGLCTALWAIEKLFDVDFGHRIFEDLFAFSCLILGPVYALSWVPKTFKFSEENCVDPPGLKFIVNWISVPMVFMYLAILYAYFGKMILEQSVPNGILACLISGFVGAGIVTYLVSWPLRDVGSAQLRLFHKVFFPALIIPVGFHFFAIWERISAYGVTEHRYFILMTAVWFATIALGNVKGKMPIKAIPMTLSILLLFASFGPWGAVSVSGNSQFSRLEKSLVEHDLLIDGEIIPVEDEDDVPFEAQKDISSMVNYLCNSGRGDILKFYFEYGQDKKRGWRENADNDVYVCLKRDNMKTELGFGYVSKWNRRNDPESISVWSSSRGGRVFDISTYDYLIKSGGLKVLGSKECSSPSCTMDKSNFVEVYREKDTAKLVFKYESLVFAEYDLSKFLMEHRSRENGDEDLFIEFENERIKLRMNVNNAYGQVKDEKPILTSLNYDLFYTLKDAVE